MDTDCPISRKTVVTTRADTRLRQKRNQKRGRLRVDHKQLKESDGLSKAGRLRPSARGGTRTHDPVTKREVGLKPTISQQNARWDSNPRSRNWARGGTQTHDLATPNGLLASKGVHQASLVLPCSSWDVSQGERTVDTWTRLSLSTPRSLSSAVSLSVRKTETAIAPNLETEHRHQTKTEQRILPLSGSRTSGWSR